MTKFMLPYSWIEGSHEYTIISILSENISDDEEVAMYVHDGIAVFAVNPKDSTPEYSKYGEYIEVWYKQDFTGLKH